jgi:hypothetical protein
VLANSIFDNVDRGMPISLAVALTICRIFKSTFAIAFFTSTES